MRYRISNPAHNDIDAIWDYIAEHDLDAADHFTIKLAEIFMLLTTQPQMGSNCDELGPGLQRFAVGNYLILYRITLDHLEIVRIVHGAQDIEAILQTRPK